MEHINRPLTGEAARKLMALDVQDKEILTYEKLDEWYTAWGGRCYVSFSGGKDSTVLAYLAARYLSREINEGRIRRRHIKDMLAEEYGVEFGE